MGLFKSLFGTYSTKELKRIEPIKNAVLALEDKYAKMSEQELKSRTGILKDRLAAGETLDDILPDAFAVCREASHKSYRHTPLPRTDHRRHRAPSGTYRRDEDR